MPLPQLTDEQRKAALKKASEARSARAKLLQSVKSGELTFKAVLGKVGDPVVDKLKVSALIKSLPGYGNAKATKVMEELGISDTRRVGGLGNRQKQALIERLS
jgi:hypothetical protein